MTEYFVLFFVIYEGVLNVKALDPSSVARGIFTRCQRWVVDLAMQVPAWFTVHFSWQYCPA